MLKNKKEWSLKIGNNELKIRNTIMLKIKNYDAESMK